MTTLLKRSSSPGREAAGRALREAGVGVVEVDGWEEAAVELERCEAALVLCSDEVDAARIASTKRA
jgi:hypothetical protein